MGESYKGAGVDITAGEEAVDAIKGDVRSTYRPEVIGDIGGFGGLFAFPQHRFKNPVLVSSTDGVGTKALVAQAVGQFETIGIDLVAMCVDDLVCQGAEPLFFLDYIAVGKLDPGHIKQLVKGIAAGCRTAGCALVGGEMAEHPGAMEPGEFDLVGFAVGVVDRNTWEPPRVFGEIQRLGDIDDEEMARVFNLGIGMIVVVAPDDLYRSLDVLRSNGHIAQEIGTISDGNGRVHLVGR